MTGFRFSLKYVLSQLVTFQNKIFCEETSETGETSDDTSEGISDSGLP